MSKYRVEFHYAEYGSVEIEAASIEEADEIVVAALKDNPREILERSESDNREYGTSNVEEI